MGDLLVRTHKDLEVWNLAMNLAEQVYGLSSNFPKNEAFGLVQQMRRSAVSVPSNIAEGAARQSTKEFIQFFSISMGSLSELETQLMLSQRLHYVSDEIILELLILVRKHIIGLMTSLKKRL